MAETETDPQDRRTKRFWEFLGFMLLGSAFAGHAIVSGKYELLLPAVVLGVLGYFGIVVSTMPSPTLTVTSRNDREVSREGGSE